MQHLCCRSAAFLFCCHVAIFYCCVSDARLLIAFLHVCCNLSWCCSDVFLMCCCSSVAVMLLFCCLSVVFLVLFWCFSATIRCFEHSRSKSVLHDFVWKLFVSLKIFLFCSASSWQAICHSMTSQFARVVKGVDLRSTAGNCARARTPTADMFNRSHQQAEELWFFTQANKTYWLLDRTFIHLLLLRCDKESLPVTHCLPVLWSRFFNSQMMSWKCAWRIDVAFEHFQHQKTRQHYEWCFAAASFTAAFSVIVSLCFSDVFLLFSIAFLLLLCSAAFLLLFCYPSFAFLLPLPPAAFLLLFNCFSVAFLMLFCCCFSVAFLHPFCSSDAFLMCFCCASCSFCCLHGAHLLLWPSCIITFVCLRFDSSMPAHLFFTDCRCCSWKPNADQIPWPVGHSQFFHYKDFETWFVCFDTSQPCKKKQKQSVVVFNVYTVYTMHQEQPLGSAHRGSNPFAVVLKLLLHWMHFWILGGFNIWWRIWIVHLGQTEWMLWVRELQKV